MPATPKPASSTPRVTDPRPKSSAASTATRKPIAGDPRVAGERGRAEQPDPSRQHRPQTRLVLARLAVGRRHQREPAGHDRLRDERQPPVDGAEQPAAQRRQRDRRRLHRRERPHRPPDLARRHLVGQPGEQQRRQERVRAALQRPHDQERAERRHERGEHRQQRVDDVAGAHHPPPPEPLAEGPGDQLERGERDEIGRDRERHARGRGVERLAQLRDEHRDHAAAERPEEAADVEGKSAACPHVKRLP